MKHLVIIGASALGREVCSYATVCGIKVKGFLDSRANVLDDYNNYPPILSSVKDYKIASDDIFVCAIGDSAPRKQYVNVIKRKGGEFTSIVHPSAIVGANVSIGIGCIIRPYAVIGNDATIGNHVILGTQSLVAHDCKIGDYVTVSPGCHIAGWCNLDEEVFAGIHAALVPHVTIGKGVFVAAGAVVTKSVVSGRVMGVPAVRK